MWGYPHALDLPDRVLVKLYCTTAHRLLSQTGNEQQTSWGHQFVRMCRNAQGRIETRLKALAQFSEILLNAPPGLLTGGIGDGDLDHGCDQKPLDLRHCRYQFHTLALAQWLQQGMSKGIGPVIKLCTLTQASLGQLDLANPSIILARSHHKQALFLK